MSVETVAWLLVVIEIQVGILLLFWGVFRLGNGFVHLGLGGVTATIYCGVRQRTLLPVPHRKEGPWKRARQGALAFT